MEQTSSVGSPLPSASARVGTVCDVSADCTCWCQLVNQTCFCFLIYSSPNVTRITVADTRVQVASSAFENSLRNVTCLFYYAINTKLFFEPAPEWSWCVAPVECSDQFTNSIMLDRKSVCRELTGRLFRLRDDQHQLFDVWLSTCILICGQVIQLAPHDIVLETDQGSHDKNQTLFGWFLDKTFNKTTSIHIYINIYLVRLYIQQETQCKEAVGMLGSKNTRLKKEPGVSRPWRLHIICIQIQLAGRDQTNSRRGEWLTQVAVFVDVNNVSQSCSVFSLLSLQMNLTWTRCDWLLRYVHSLPCCRQNTNTPTFLFVSQ